ncbi:RNA-binding S4 domain-containing protein [Tindallia magadiensis]
MKEEEKGMKSFQVEGEYIKLDQLLKAAEIVDSGGQAKIFINAGIVAVNGEVVYQRGKKIYPGDEVTVDHQQIKIT